MKSVVYMFELSDLHKMLCICERFKTETQILFSNNIDIGVDLAKWRKNNRRQSVETGEFSKNAFQKRTMHSKRKLHFRSEAASVLPKRSQSPTPSAVDRGNSQTRPSPSNKTWTQIQTLLGCLLKNYTTKMKLSFQYTCLVTRKCLENKGQLNVNWSSAPERERERMFFFLHSTVESCNSTTRYHPQTNFSYVCDFSKLSSVTLKTHQREYGTSPARSCRAVFQLPPMAKGAAVQSDQAWKAERAAWTAHWSNVTHAF